MFGERTEGVEHVVAAMGDNVERLKALWSGCWEDFLIYLGWQTEGVGFALEEIERNVRSGARVLVVWGQYCIPMGQMDPLQESEQMRTLFRVVEALEGRCAAEVFFSGGVQGREYGYREFSARSVHAQLDQETRLSTRFPCLVDGRSQNTGAQAQALARHVSLLHGGRQSYTHVVLVLPRCHIARFSAALAYAIQGGGMSQEDRPMIIPAAWGEWDSVTRFGLTQAQEAFDPMTPTSAEGADVLGGVASVRTPVDQLVEGVVPEGMCGQYGATRYHREVTARPEGPFAWNAYGPKVMLRLWR